MTSYYGYTKEIHKSASHYIENEIWALQTSLITDALSLENSIAGLRFDNIENLYFTDEGGEEAPQEIFEWYLVSEWIAEKLADQGEPVLYGDYNFYWGRTCTGQSIILDGTFQGIAEGAFRLQ